MRFLGAIELAILSAGRLFPEQRRRESLFHERLADPVHRGGPAFHRLSHPLIVPARPARARIGLEQNARVEDHRRRSRPRAAQILPLGALFIGQADDVFGQRHRRLQVGGYPHRKTHALLEVNSDRVKY